MVGARVIAQQTPWQVVLYEALLSQQVVPGSVATTSQITADPMVTPLQDGDLVGTEVVGAIYGKVVRSEVVGDVVGEIVGSEVVGESVGDMVGSEVVGEIAGDSVGSDVVGDTVGSDVVGDTDGVTALGLSVLSRT